MTPEELAAQATNPNTASVEVTEALQIRAIAEQLGHGRKADEILGQLPLAEARAAIMAHLSTQSAKTTVKSLEELGASQAEVREYNYGRAMLNAVGIAEGGSGGRNFESEISETMEKGMPSNYKRHGGVFVPYAVKARGQRDTPMATNAVGSGAEAVFVQPGQVIDVLRNSLVTAKLGASLFTGLDAPLGMPRQDTDVVASWVAEDGTTDVPETEMATSLVTLSPHTLQATTATTRQLLELAIKSFDVQGRIINSLGFAHAKAIDLAALYGTGVAPQPMGIANAPGVNSVAFGAATGVVPTAPYAYQDLLKMVAAVFAANINDGKFGWATNPQLAALLMGVLKFNVNGSSELWQGSILEGQMAGFAAASSNQMPSNLGSSANCQGLIFGAWNNLLIGSFGDSMEIIVDPFSLKKRGIIELTSFGMADVKLAHAAAFSVATGIALTGTAQSTD